MCDQKFKFPMANLDRHALNPPHHPIDTFPKKHTQLLYHFQTFSIYSMLSQLLNINSFSIHIE